MKSHVKFALSSAVAIVAWSAFGSSAMAQYSLTSASPSVFENFNAYTGTAAPTNWSITSGTNATIAYRSNDDGNNSGGGIRAYGANNTTNQRALGFFGNGVSENFQAKASFVNNTGASLTSLSVDYVAAQWRVGNSRISGFTVEYSADNFVTSTPLTTGLGFNAPVVSNAATGANTPINAFGAGNFSSLSYTFSPTAVIPNGSTFQLRWTYNGSLGGGAGARQALSIDNVRVSTSVPEPAASGFILAALPVLGRRWRR